MKHVVEKTTLKQVQSLEPFFTELHVEIDDANEYLFSSCYHQQIKVLELSSGKVVKSIPNKIDDYEGETIVNFTINKSDEIAIAFSSGILRQFKWTSDPVQLVRTWKSFHSGPVSRMGFDATGQLLATGGTDASVKVWDTVRQYCTHNLKGLTGVVSAIAYQPDPTTSYKFVAAGALNYDLAVWDLVTSKLLTKLTGHVGTVTVIKFLPHDNEKIITGARDNVVIIWSLESNSALHKFPVFDTVEDLIWFTPSETQQLIKKDVTSSFMVAGQSGKFKLFNTETGALLFEQTNTILTRTDDSGVPAVTQLMKFERLNQYTVVTPENNVIFYDINEGKSHLKLTKQLTGHFDDVLSLRFLGKDQQHVVVATNSPTIKVFDLQTSACVLVNGHTDIVVALEVFRAKPNMFVTSSKDNTIRVWKFNAETMSVKCLFRGAGHSHSVTSITVPVKSTDFVVSGSEDTTIKVWKLPKRETKETSVIEINTIAAAKAHDKDINCIAMAPNDKFICSVSEDKTAKIWSVGSSEDAVGAEKLKLTGTIRGHRRGIWCAAFSPVDQIVATGSADMTVRVWALADMSCLKTFQGHECSILSLLFCSRGMQVVSTGSDGNVKIWSVKTSECVATVDAHQDKVWSIDMRSDETHFITGSADSRIAVWRDDTEAMVLTETKARDQLVEQTQNLMNYLQRRKWMKALKLAIKLEQPFRSLTVLKELLLEEKSFDKVVAQLETKLRDDQLLTLLRMALNWNKNSKHSTVAQLVIKAVLLKFDPEELLKLDDAKVIMATLLPYTERHAARAQRLLQQATFLEFVWNSWRLSGLSLNDPTTTVEVAPPTPVASSPEDEESESEEELVKMDTIVHEEKKHRVVRIAQSAAVEDLEGNIDVDAGGEREDEEEEGVEGPSDYLEQEDDEEDVDSDDVDDEEDDSGMSSDDDEGVERPPILGVDIQPPRPKPHRHSTVDMIGRGEKFKEEVGGSDRGAGSGRGFQRRGRGTKSYDDNRRGGSGDRRGHGRHTRNDDIQGPKQPIDGGAGGFARRGSIGGGARGRGRGRPYRGGKTSSRPRS